ncbi:MAG: hypothetical protein QNJ41_19820 [Xenococcaceae cyanobacterium MO_188.B32]|nr:hypothetical protein [Xenococcaceae cyanobacterium MO_188.B32]
MEVRELKFLLKLAGLSEYKGKISELKPTSSTKIADTEKICRRLGDRALVDYQERVTKFKLSSVGKALLKLNVEQLPLTTAELTILQACSQDIITPQQTKVTPAKIRNKIINSLIERGLITAVTTQIRQVWLTDKGKKHLLTEYTPQGTNPVLSLDLLHNYLCLFRQNNCLATTNELISVYNPSKLVKQEVYTQKKDFSLNYGKNKLASDERVLQTIYDLDRQLNTNNYLPIFYLREKLQPFLSREELDLALYRLQRKNKLELSSIVESSKYTREQLQAGIPQNVGGCLFFLIVS